MKEYSVMFITEIPEAKKETRTEKISEEIMTEYFPKTMKSHHSSKTREPSAFYTGGKPYLPPIQTAENK